MEDNSKAVIRDSIKLAYKEYAEEPMSDFYGHPIVGVPSRLRVKKIIQRLAGIKGRVLDIGCEAGYLLRHLSINTSAGLFGLDPCLPALLDFKRYKLDPSATISICANTAQEISFKSASFDAVICTEVIEHAPHIEIIFSEVARVLKEDGIFIVTMPHERLRKLFYPIIKLLGINSDIEEDVTLFDYDREYVAEKLRAHFSIERSFTLFRFLPLTFFYFCGKTR